MTKQDNKPVFPKEAADKGVATIVAAMVSLFTKGGTVLTATQALEVSRTLGYVRGQQGAAKDDKARIYPTLAGCRFASLDEVTAGYALAAARFKVTELVGERATFVAKVTATQALLRAIGGDEKEAPAREMLLAQAKEHQASIDTINAKLAKFADIVEAIDAKERAAQFTRYANARHTMAKLAILAAHDADTVAPLLAAQEAIAHDASAMLRTLGYDAVTMLQAQVDAQAKADADKADSAKGKSKGKAA